MTPSAKTRITAHRPKHWSAIKFGATVATQNVGLSHRRRIRAAKRTQSKPIEANAKPRFQAEMGNSRSADASQVTKRTH
jgi:hypothetical protein